MLRSGLLSDCSLIILKDTGVNCIRKAVHASAVADMESYFCDVDYRGFAKQGLFWSQFVRVAVAFDEVLVNGDA